MRALSGGCAARLLGQARQEAGCRSFGPFLPKPSDVRAARAARPRRRAAGAGTRKCAARGRGRRAHPGQAASAPSPPRPAQGGAGAGAGPSVRGQDTRANLAVYSGGQYRPPVAHVAGAEVGVAHRRQDMQSRLCLKGRVQRQRAGGDHSCHPRRQPGQGRCDGLRNRRQGEGDRRHDAGPHDQPAGNTGRFRHACRRTSRLQGNLHAKGRTAGRPNGPGGRVSAAGFCERLCANRRNLTGRKAVQPLYPALRRVGRRFAACTGRVPGSRAEGSRRVGRELPRVRGGHGSPCPIRRRARH